MILSYVCHQHISVQVLNIAFIFGLAITILITYTSLNEIFKLTPLNSTQLISVLMLASLTIISSELIKAFDFKFKLKFSSKK